MPNGSQHIPRHEVHGSVTIDNTIFIRLDGINVVIGS